MDSSDLKQSEEYKKAREYAIGRLSRIECSADSLRQKMILKGATPQIADLIVDELKQKSWVSDERYAKMLIRQQATRSKGSRFIRQKLKEQGIDMSCDQVRKIATEETTTSEVDTARAFVERKYPKFAEDRKIAIKASQALLRRGFTYDIVQQVNHLMSKDPGDI